MQDRKPIGEFLDSLGVTQHVHHGEVVAGAVVLLKIVDLNGDVALRAAWSEGMSWIERIGMLRAAERCELPAESAPGWHD